MIFPGLNLQAMLAIAAGLVIAALAAWGFYWRGEAAEARGALELQKSQTAIVAAAAKACSAGVDQAKRAGDAAVAAGAELLEAARRLKAPVREVVRHTERVIAEPAPVRADGQPADCRDAWARIERDPKLKSSGGSP